MFEDFDFSPQFDVVVDPEFPGDGDWGAPTFAFGRDGELLTDPESRWGTPAVLEVEPSSSPRWVGTFAAGGLGRYRVACATPSPAHLCVVVDGLAYLVGVDRPEAGALIAHDQVGQVVPVSGLPLLLLVRFIDIVAIGQHGVAWRTGRLVVDDLAVVSAGPKSIVCSGDLLDGGTSTIEIDPHTGTQTVGTRLDSFWPPDAL
jgi:hypothetical protein